MEIWQEADQNSQDLGLEDLVPDQEAEAEDEKTSKKEIILSEDGTINLEEEDTKNSSSEKVEDKKYKQGVDKLSDLPENWEEQYGI